LDYQNPLNLIP